MAHVLFTVDRIRELAHTWLVGPHSGNLHVVNRAEDEIEPWNIFGVPAPLYKVGRTDTHDIYLGTSADGTALIAYQGEVFDEDFDNPLLQRENGLMFWSHTGVALGWSFRFLRDDEIPYLGEGWGK